MTLVDDIRANLHLLEGQTRKDMTALCDALEAAEKERDALRDNQHNWADKVDKLDYEKGELIEENRVLREGLDRLEAALPKEQG